MRALLFAAILALPCVALPQSNFPSRPVTLTVGYPPGGGPDAVARILAKKLSENLGVPMVVENKPGAGGVVAVQHIASAPAEGYVLHLAAVGALAIAPAMGSTGYDIKKDVAPISLVVSLPNIFVAPANSPVKNMKEFIALAKQKPGQLTYASVGVGSSSHLAGELLKQRAGIDILHIPYKGAGPAATDVLGARVDAACATVAAFKPHVEAGRLIALAVTGPTRSPQMPNVPTVAEFGLPGYEVTTWYLLMAPAKTSRDVLDFWNREIGKALKDPGVVADLAKQGMDVTPSTREEASRYLAAESEKWAKVVRDGNIKAE